MKVKNCFLSAAGVKIHPFNMVDAITLPIGCAIFEED